MEEILTVDGKQFKLITDVPLTAEQKAQTIAEIRKQTGCGTCGQPRYSGMASAGGRMVTMAPGYSCPAPGASGSSTNPKSSTNTVGLASAPMVGTAPYTVEFLRNPTNNSGEADIDASDSIPFARIPGTYKNYTTTLTVATTANPQLNVAEATAAGTPTISVTYTLDDFDIANYARVRGADTIPSILFRVSLTDSCPTGAQTCSEICKIFVTCPTPTCNFTVT